MTHKFKIVEDYVRDGERYFVDDKEVGYVDHDSVGWDGMIATRNMFESIAQAIGAEIEHDDLEDEEDD